MRKRISKDLQPYFKWLLTWLEVPDRYQTKNYILILSYLLSREFYWGPDFAMDENRASDALNLRSLYDEEELVFEDDFLKTLPNASVLEVMISLSDRIETEFIGDPDLGDRRAIWFWLMMKNLGLDQMTDVIFDERKACEIVDNFLNRAYCKDGFGSLFVTKRHFDMRKMEIWDAMNVWIGDFLL